MMICFSAFIAAVRAFTAVSRATVSCRIISTAPSAVFGVAVAWPASTDRAAASGVDGVGLAGDTAQALVPSVHFQDPARRS